jgi:hypothetical protein
MSRFYEGHAMAKRNEPVEAADPAATGSAKSRPSGSSTRARQTIVPGAADSSVTQAPSSTERRNVDTASDRSEMAAQPSEDDIRLRAYHRYLERGGGHGMDFADWLEAERELTRNKGSNKH